MARIYNFPTFKKSPATGETSAPAPTEIRKEKALDKLARGVWIAVVLLWPIARWVVSIDVFIRLLVMFYHWDNPESYAGWTFLFHASFLVALTYYVGVYRPKGVE